MLKPHRMFRRCPVQVGGVGMAAFFQEALVVSVSADPFARGSLPCFLGNQAHHVMDARRFVGPAVQLKKPGGKGQEVTVSVVETGREGRDYLLCYY